MLLLTIASSKQAFNPCTPAIATTFFHTTLRLLTGSTAFTACPVQVATTLHRLEQAKYWSGLKQRHSSQVLATKQRSAIEGQMADCMRSTEAAPAAELVAMVLAGCEAEVCLCVVSVCRGNISRLAYVSVT